MHVVGGSGMPLSLLKANERASVANWVGSCKDGNSTRNMKPDGFLLYESSKGID
jgi:hypothetical protein